MTHASWPCREAGVSGTGRGAVGAGRDVQARCPAWPCVRAAAIAQHTQVPRCDEGCRLSTLNQLKFSVGLKSRAWPRRAPLGLVLSPLRASDSRIGALGVSLASPKCQSFSSPLQGILPYLTVCTIISFIF